MKQQIQKPKLIKNSTVYLSGLQLHVRVPTQKITFFFLNQMYVVGTQKNRLSETVLLRTSNIC